MNSQHIIEPERRSSSRPRHNRIQMRGSAKQMSF